MTGPGGKEVGRVNIRVLPDTSKFGPELKAYLERAEAKFNLDLPVSLNQRDVAKVEAELDALTRDRDVDINLNDNLSRGLGSVGRLGAEGVPLFLKLGSAIGVVAVAVGALTAGLPGLVALLGAPVAAAIVGWDGIKKAASELKDEVKDLRTEVSATFEREMEPGFKRLEKLFPHLSDGLDDVATSLSGVFDEITKSLTSDSGLERLDSIFTNVSDALDRIAPAMDPFVQSLLLLADAGTKASASIAPEFVDLFERFADRLETMSKNGDLQKGMEGLGHGLLLIGAGLGSIVLSGIEAMAMLERIGEAINKFLEKLGIDLPPGGFMDLFTAFFGAPGVIALVRGTWDQVGDDIEEKFGEIADFLRKTPEEWQQLGADIVNGLWDGLKSVWPSVQSWAEEKINGLITSYRDLLEINSPSKVFMRFGEGIGEGFQKGMENSFGGVESAAMALARSPIQAAKASSFDTEASAPASTLGGGITRADLEWHARTIASLMGLATNGAINDQLAFAGTTSRMAR